MTPIPFEIPSIVLADLLHKYPTKGKNSDIGKIAVEIAKEYFKQVYSNPQFPITDKGIDLTVINGSNVEHFEIKGTEDNKISFPKLKVSGKPCYNHLTTGKTTLLRITKIRQKEVNIYLLKHGEHFTLAPEDRWKFVEIK